MLLIGKIDNLEVELDFGRLEFWVCLLEIEFVKVN